MATRKIVLVNQSSMPISYSDISDVANALQIQLDRDFSPIWGIQAQVIPLASHHRAPAGAWKMRILDHSEYGLGVHLDAHGRPFAEIQAGSDWSITASHELLEMLVDPLGHTFKQAPDIDPATDKHLVSYLVEVGDPCEIYSYLISSIAVSDFVTPDYYDVAAGRGTEIDFLGHLTHPFEVPTGCYISWQDPRDGRWHQKQTDGTFVTGRSELGEGNPRDSRDLAFGEEEGERRHDLAHILEAYRPNRD